MQINQAQGEAEAVVTVADATAEAIKKVARAINEPGGIQAVNLQVAENYIDAFSQLAQKGNTLIIPSNLSDISGLVASAMTVVKQSKD